MSDGDCTQTEAEATLVITADGRLLVRDLPYEQLEEMLAALEELLGPVGRGSLFGPVGLCG